MTETHSTPLRSYGRRQGRKLKTTQSELVKSLLPKLLITLPANAPLYDAQKPLWFEIGFGGGEHLVEQARKHPHINFIGCEPYINGMAKLLAAIEKDKLSNIRLYDGDARSLLEALPDESIERLFVLFPDPWPKARHNKRRLISQASLALFYQKLKAGGLLRIASDHEDYVQWILEQLMLFNKLKWTAQQHTDWEMPPADWVRTRYQAKAEAEGRAAVFLDWIKPLSQ